MSKPRENGSTGNTVGGTAFYRFVPGAESHVCLGTAPAFASGPSAAELVLGDTLRGYGEILGEVARPPVALAPSFKDGFQATTTSAGGGGGRGIYARVGGDLPVASAATCGGFDSFQEMDPSAAGPGLAFRPHGPHLDARHGIGSRVRPRPTTHAALDILHMNIQGFLSHAAELVAFVRLCHKPPAIICLNETFLDKSIVRVELEGYEVSARRDREDGRKCGGVLVFSRTGMT